MQPFPWLLNVYFTRNIFANLKVQQFALSLSNRFCSAVLRKWHSGQELSASLLLCGAPPWLQAADSFVPGPLMENLFEMSEISQSQEHQRSQYNWAGGGGSRRSGHLDDAEMVPLRTHLSRLGWHPGKHLLVAFSFRKCTLSGMKRRQAGTNNPLGAWLFLEGENFSSQHLINK